MQSKTFSIAIDCEPKAVYAFVSDLSNLPKWGKTFCRSIKRTNGGWILESPQGRVGIRMSEPNALGVLDHYVSPAPGVEFLVPMRVVANGTGSEVVFTLFKQPGMSEDNFQSDIGMVEKDLATLKDVLENTKV